MKQIDVSSKIMDRVVGFEKRRSLFWLLRIFVVVILLGFLGALFLVSAFSELNNLQSWDLLAPFINDFDQATQIWRDLLTAFWAELPKITVFTAAAFLVTALLVVVLKRKQIKTFVNRLITVWLYRRPRT